MSDTPKVLRWGICSAGKISHDFANALRTQGLPSYGLNVPHAVAASSLDKAREFAKTHQIPRFYGSYEELAKDPEIDVAYVGVISSLHYPVSKLMLENGKHVLCEKAMMMNREQTEDILELARSKNLFIMEALWTRFFPAIDKLRQVLANGDIGELLLLEVSFGYPTGGLERLNSRELGGGCLLDLLVYPIQIACVVFGGQKPVHVYGRGALFPSGVEESCVAILEYEGGKFAQLSAHLRTHLRNVATIYGTKGRIEVPYPVHAPTQLVLPSGTLEFPLPPPSASPSFFHYENSSGLSYQAAAVRECILEGKLESPLMSHAETRITIQVIDELRQQLGSHF